MANLDSPSKRASSVGICLISTAAPPFPPDGTIGDADRQHIALSYSGISAGAPVVVVDDNDVSHFIVAKSAHPQKDHLTESGSHFGWTMPFSLLPSFWTQARSYTWLTSLSPRLQLVLVQRPAS